MTRTFISQPQQIFNSELYSDTLVQGSTLSSSATNLQDDLNALRTQVKVLLYGSSGSAGNWYDALTTITSGSNNFAGRGVNGSTGLNGGLVRVENKGFLYRLVHTSSIFVSASQNWIALVPDELPLGQFAYGPTGSGPVVTKLTGVFNTFNIDNTPGTVPLFPKNLVLIASASSLQTIHSTTNADHEIFGLLQVHSASNDGDNFATGSIADAGQISFVCVNTAGTALVGVPTSEIAGKRLTYAYNTRVGYTSVPEDAWVPPFQDFDTLVVSTTLAQVIANQGGTPFTASNSVDWLIQSSQYVAFRSGTQSLFRIDVANPGGSVAFNVTDFSVNNTNTANFTKGASFNTSSNFVNVGVTAGQIDASGSLTLKAVNAALILTGQYITFADAYNAGSTHTGSIIFSTSSGDWTSYMTNFGDRSLLGSLNQLSERIATISSTFSGSTLIAHGTAILTASATAGTNLTTAAGSKNLSGSLPAYTSGVFDAKVFVYLNGVRVLPGSGYDVYPGVNTAIGDLKFNDDLRAGTALTVDVFS